MEKYRVTILPENTTITVESGMNLFTALSNAGVNISSPCGRRGTCGKCAVRVVDGECEMNSGANSHLPQKLREEGYILACQAQIKSDLTVEVPDFSRLARHKVELHGRKTGFFAGNDYPVKHKMNPISRKYYVELDRPDLSDSMNDWDRLRTALLKIDGVSDPVIGIRCLRKLPEAMRAGDWKLTVTVAWPGGECEIIDIEPGKSNKPAYGLAVDLGTTTVAAGLLNLENGEVIDVAGTYNKQAPYGSDVISRIIYADENQNGLNELQRAAIDTINSLIDDITDKNSINGSDIAVMAIGGNTVMTHMLMGLTPAYLRLEPYVPVAVDFPPVKACQLGIAINQEAPVIATPSVASYVGGDITAGLLAVGLHHSERLTLFIDIGTNGELVLGNNEWMVACSCSAGPAFEGSGIRNGMRAMDGAIDRIEIDPESYEVRCRTIGDVKPAGICGSGLIYSLSEMRKAGIIDRAGQLNENIISPRIRKGSEGLEYVLVFAGDSGSGQDIVITQSDVKNLLRAKGAVFAGIRTMLNEVRLSVDDIEKVYIAGGFGNYINIGDAINIGLLPDLPEDRFEFVGNSCLHGTMLVLLSREAFEETVEISGKITYLELSVGNRFMDEFVSALFIPHTDLGLFGMKGNGDIKERSCGNGDSNSCGG